MEFIPPHKTIWSQAKKYKLFALASFLFWPLLWLLCETTKHRMFSWINEEMDRRAGPMIYYVGVFVKWLIDNPLTVYIFIAISYCLIVIIGAQLSYSKVKKIMFVLQELHSELDNIAKDKWVNYNYYSIRPAIGLLTEWKDRAKRILFKLFGQAELNNFNDKISYVNEINDYANSSIGYIQAFYNEKEVYLKYLEDLLDSIQKHPELWS